jgi:hypothetical protein
MAVPGASCDDDAACGICPGFRFAQVFIRVPAGFTVSDVTVVSLNAFMINSNMTWVGRVATAPVTGLDIGVSDLLNRVQHVTVSAQRSNLMSIPTDCPQRERRGWMGQSWHAGFVCMDVCRAATPLLCCAWLLVSQATHTCPRAKVGAA